MRDRVLAAAAGGALFCVAMSERGAGSRLSQMTTSYEKVDGGWRIVGSKAFCSGAGHADGYLVVGGRDRRRPGQRRSRSSSYRPALAGITVEPTWDSLGMRATASHDLHLDVVVADDALVGGMEDLGVLLAQAMPQWLVASYAAVYVGVAQAALDAGVAYAQRAWARAGSRWYGPGSAGPTLRSPLPARSCGWRPAGSTRRRVTPRPTGGCGGPSCSPGTPRSRSPRRCSRPAARGRPGAAACSGAALPRRPLRRAAAGHERRLLGLAGHCRPRPRPGAAGRRAALVGQIPALRRCR